MRWAGGGRAGGGGRVDFPVDAGGSGVAGGGAVFGVHGVEAW